MWTNILFAITFGAVLFAVGKLVFPKPEYQIPEFNEEDIYNQTDHYENEV